jgi:hypothetical protein
MMPPSGNAGTRRRPTAGGRGRPSTTWMTRPSPLCKTAAQDARTLSCWDSGLAGLPRRASLTVQLGQHADEKAQHALVDEGMNTWLVHHDTVKLPHAKGTSCTHTTTWPVCCIKSRPVRASYLLDHDLRALVAAVELWEPQHLVHAKSWLSNCYTRSRAVVQLQQACKDATTATVRGGGTLVDGGYGDGRDLQDKVELETATTWVATEARTILI